MKFLHKASALICGFFNILTGKGGPFHAEEKRLANTYYPPSCELHSSFTPGIVMMVDGHTMHGGLSDRLRGICSIFYWCQSHKVPFHIHFVSPFSLADYLPPASYDWTIDETQLSYSLSQARPIILMLHLLPRKLHKFYLNRLLKEACHKQLHVYSNTLVYDKYYSKCFNQLFKPSPPLLKAIEEQLAQFGGKPFIAMTLRFQQLLGDFKEGDYEVLPPDERELLIRKCLEQINLIHQREAPDSLVLITSESTTFLQRALKELPYVRIIQGEIVHMDYTTNASYGVYLKSFVDMLVLSHACKIFLLRTGHMYKSGFAYRAASITGAPYEYIDF